MLREKYIKLGVYLVLMLSLANVSCRGFRPAPLGIHGIYSRINDSVYKTNNLCKDSILDILKSKNLIIKKEYLHKYDPPWDSLRYLISNIPCNLKYIEAYVEFHDKKSNNTTFRILWFNSTPTNDDKLYKKRTEAYYKCFELLLKENNIVK